VKSLYSVFDLWNVSNFFVGAGMCVNATRNLIWKNAENLDLSPLMPVEAIAGIEEEIVLQLRVHHITAQEDYQIFNALRGGNLSLALDMIAEHKGVNAVDEWEFTPLMYAVQKSDLMLLSALLNSRKPIVDVNAMKAVNPTTATRPESSISSSSPVQFRRIEPLMFFFPVFSLFCCHQSGYSALFYAVELKATTIMKALLRRGADPNATIRQPVRNQ